MEDVLHTHGGHDDGGDSEVNHQLSSLYLLDVAREPRLHPTKVLVGVELHGGVGDASSLLDSHHHSPLLVLHQEILLEAGFLHLMARGRQLLLQCWQQDDEKIRSYGCQIG